ncbi:MAG: ankyrin repeat domain-containing protein [Vicinamibacterales bacterium]
MVCTRFVTGALAGVAGALLLSVALQAQAPRSVADAAQRGDGEGVKTLLKEAADVNAAQGDGMTALHWAAMNGDAEMAQMLLVAGANVKAVTRLGAYTPLFLAARQGRANVIPVLVKAGADPKQATATGTTPLMAAAASGSADAVTALLDAGADVNAVENVRGLNALMFAASANRHEVIKVLAGRGADLKAVTKVVDLSALTRDRLGFNGGNPQVPGQPPREGQAGAPAGQAAARPPAQGAPAANRRPPQVPGVTRQFQLNELVAGQGGFTPLLFAARDGHLESVLALLDAGAGINQVAVSDGNSPLMTALVNGHFDLAKVLVERGADVNLAAENGATPLYAVLNVQWAPKALYPQPQAYRQQKLDYLQMMKVLLDKGADVNARLKKKVWYSGYSFDLSGVDEIGATPFWRAAYAADVEAMKLLASYGADPHIPTMKPAGRPRLGDGEQRETRDTTGLPPVPLGGPSVTPLQAAAGVGYGEGFAANAHRFAPTGMLAAVQYLVEVHGADVNAVDHEGMTALHHAAARGDNEMIKYLVSKGANVKAVDREGRTTVDMANGPVQRIQPFPETIKLLESLGAVNNHKCVSC